MPRTKKNTTSYSRVIQNSGNLLNIGSGRGAKTQYLESRGRRVAKKMLRLPSSTRVQARTRPGDLEEAMGNGESRGRGAALYRGALNSYLRSIRRYPLLTSSGEKKLAIRTRNGEQVAWKRLVQANLRLVVKIAREFRHRGTAMEDLISEGNLGLMKAARRFDPARGVRFVSYASWWIRKFIIAALNRQRSQSFAPVVSSSPPGEGQNEPRPSRTRLMYLWRRVVSFEEFPHTSGDRNAVETLVPSQEQAPDEKLNETQVAEVLREALDTIPGKERKILEAHYGLAGTDPQSLQEIGEGLGCTREWIRQLEQRAIGRVRRLLESRHFKA